MGLTLIYQLGNFTGPLRHDTDPWPLKTLNEAREQLDNTPFIKLAAAYDKTPKLDYEVRDTLALLLKNRASTIEEHMRAYPGFFALGETEEIKGLLGDEEEEEVEEEEEYGGYGAEDDGTEDDGGDSLYAIWKSGSLSLTNLLSNPEVVSTVNERYEELKAIEPNSTEEKKLLAFMDDIRHFFKTGESELYNRDAIVGRWRFAPNVSLRENKKTRTSISVDEMRGIQATVGKMRRVTLQVWPEADQKQIRVNGMSVAGAYDEVLKKLRQTYQKAIDDGEVEDDAYGYDAGFSQPVGFQETYGTEGEVNENQVRDRVLPMMLWIRDKDPGWVNRQFSQIMLSGDSIQLRVGSGQWEGSGIRYQVNLKQEEKIKMSKEAQYAFESVEAGLPIRSGKLAANIVKGRLHVLSGKDVFVFTRY
jgi:hypothetical protein